MNFRDAVACLVSRIPPGRVMTYGQVAASLGLPRAARAVGTALHLLPDPEAVPWWRVINAQGRISTRCFAHPAGVPARSPRGRGGAVQRRGDSRPGALPLVAERSGRSGLPARCPQRGPARAGERASAATPPDEREQFLRRPPDLVGHGIRIGRRVEHQVGSARGCDPVDELGALLRAAERQEAVD
ncbi:MAG: hypothetical protein KatS3mg061_2276 [Dehalococcoidia bacterium]|nr:MAG: hypothetical protein KatS3mg061_2276 [Dehalococcoidia bacterium]